MTYHSDPTRWTQSQGDAPELLRSAFDAGTREGPSDFQMRALALKLAAVGGGAALAAGASTAQASATAGGGALTAGGGAMTAAATGGALTLTKIAVSLALIGAAATGTVLWQRATTQLPSATVTERALPSGQPSAAAIVAPMELPSLPAARPAVEPTPEPTPARADAVPVVAQQVPPTAEAVPSPDSPGAVVAARVVAPAGEPAATLAADRAPMQGASTAGVQVAAVARSSAPSRRTEHRAAETVRSVSRASADQAQVGETAAADEATMGRGTSRRQQVSEIELLRSARSALAARPREAYRLTEEHRSLYPRGVFTQERDALAVEALQRAGDLKLARDLAEAFVKHYPSSPHAHRFREAMSLP